MQVIECWDIRVWDGVDRYYHKYYVKDENSAKEWKKRNTFDEIRKMELVIFDNYDEMMTYDSGELRRRALAKLTAEEIKALGIKLD